MGNYYEMAPEIATTILGLVNDDGSVTPRP